jgi:hypothetical protein
MEVSMIKVLPDFLDETQELVVEGGSAIFELNGYEFGAGVDLTCINKDEMKISKLSYILDDETGYIVRIVTQPDYSPTNEEWDCIFNQIEEELWEQAHSVMKVNKLDKVTFYL